MNKKAYIQPTLNQVFVVAQSIMQASDPATITVKVSNETISSGFADSREDDFWDDED